VRKPRPIVVIDTSVFISDALSRTQAGAASQVLAILPAVATIIMCEDIREELTEKLVERFGWTKRQVMDTYGPIFDAALWLVPVEEQPIHRKVVHGDPDDTMLPRAAEAVFTQATTLLERDQEKFIVTGNPRHLKPGTNYAGFLFVTPHGLLVKMQDW
jgi:predicted nucleic acid-binding protein